MLTFYTYLVNDDIKFPITKHEPEKKTLYDKGNDDGRNTKTLS